MPRWGVLALIAVVALLSIALVGVSLVNMADSIPAAKEAMRDPIPEVRPAVIETRMSDRERYNRSVQGLMWSGGWTDEEFDERVREIVANYLELDRDDIDIDLLSRWLEDLKPTRHDAGHLRQSVGILRRLPLHEPWGVTSGNPSS